MGVGTNRDHVMRTALLVVGFINVFTKHLPTRIV